MRKVLGFATVRRMAEGWDEVEVGTTYNTPALKVRGKVFACIASHKSAEPDTLVTIVGFDERERLIAAEPDIYYLKDHYRNYPTVLVRLRKVHPDALRDLLHLAWRFVSASRARPRRPRRRTAIAPRVRRRPPAR